MSEPVVGDESVASLADATVEDAPALDERSESERQRDEYLDALQRLKAEFDNFRKRMARDQENLFARANERLVKQLIHVVDDLERAIEAAAAQDRKRVV